MFSLEDVVSLVSSALPQIPPVPRMSYAGLVLVCSAIFFSILIKLLVDRTSQVEDTPRAMGIELYYLPLSAPCRSVMLLAKELGIDLELKRLELFQGEHLKPWFLELNPQHTIPTMNDNGYILSESRAIIQYLQNQYGKDESLYPTDPKKRGIVDHRLNFDVAILAPRIKNYFFPVAFRGAPHFSEEAKNQLDEAVGWLDEFIEKSGGWVAGPTKTIADYSILSTVANIAELRSPYAIDLTKHKNVVEWLAKCKAELKGYDEAMGQGAAEWGEFVYGKVEGKEVK